ncbi:MAG TPA: nuclear transport factor 2 family protein [Rhodocyclaceae bacterium]|nr:nuclear transport factor 2 family protein [Rhodocyclaceae bacterium]
MTEQPPHRYGLCRRPRHAGRLSRRHGRSSQQRCGRLSSTAMSTGGKPADNEGSNMRRQHIFQIGMAGLAVLVLAAETIIAATSAASAVGIDETSKTEAAVIAVDQHWMEAELGGDTAWLDNMLLPEYRSVGTDGAVHPKVALMAHAAKNRGNDAERRKVEAWLKTHPSGESVVIHGDTAILTFYDPAQGAAKDVRSSDIFVYVDGRWHALYSQHSSARSD